MPWWWGYTETVSPSPPRLHRISTKLGSEEPFAESPLYPDERTSSDRADWSVSCHKQTLNVQAARLGFVKMTFNPLADTFGVLAG